MRAAGFRAICVFRGFPSCEVACLAYFNFPAPCDSYADSIRFYPFLCTFYAVSMPFLCGFYIDSKRVLIKYTPFSRGKMSNAIARAFKKNNCRTQTQRARERPEIEPRAEHRSNPAAPGFLPRFICDRVRLWRSVPFSPPIVQPSGRQAAKRRSGGLKSVQFCPKVSNSAVTKKSQLLFRTSPPLHPQSDRGYAPLCSRRASGSRR